MRDEAIDLTLRNLARCHRADWIPRVGIGLALLIGIISFFWAWNAGGHGAGGAFVTFIGATVIAFVLIALAGLPLALYRHRCLMRERLRFLFPLRAHYTGQAMARLRALEHDPTSDERYRCLARFVATQHDYRHFFDGGRAPDAAAQALSHYQPSAAELAAAREMALPEAAPIAPPPQGRRSPARPTGSGPDQTAVLIPLDTGRRDDDDEVDRTGGAAIPLELPRERPAAPSATERLVRRARSRVRQRRDAQ